MSKIKNPKIRAALFPVLLGAAITYTYTVLSYIPMLDKTRCDCATQGDWRDNFIFWFMIASLILPLIGAFAGFAIFAASK